jgi:hypothetical protein
MQSRGAPVGRGSQILIKLAYELVRLSAVRTGRLYPQEILLVLISVKGRADPRVTPGPEGQRQ